jgi:hypothetical protein
MGMLLLVLCVFSSQVVGQTEEVDQLHPNLDDFTSLLCQDDARMLVDLLKLAVAGRAVDTAKETIVNVLVGTFTQLFITCDSRDAGHLGKFFFFLIVHLCNCYSSTSH